MPVIKPGTQIGADGKRYPAGSPELQKRPDASGTVINVDNLAVDNTQVVEAIEGLKQEMAASWADTRKGNTYMAGTGRLALTDAGYVRATIGNPRDSGRVCVLTHMTGYLAAGPAFATVILNPSIGLPNGDRRASVNTVLGGPPGCAVIYADTDTDTPLGGGFSSGISFGLPQAERFEISLPGLRVRPGLTLGLNIPIPVATETSLTVYWYEEPA